MWLFDSRCESFVTSLRSQTMRTLPFLRRSIRIMPLSISSISCSRWNFGIPGRYYSVFFLWIFFSQTTTCSISHIQDAFVWDFEWISFWKGFEMQHKQTLERFRFFAWKTSKVTRKTLLVGNKASQISLIAAQCKILNFWGESNFSITTPFDPNYWN